MSCGPQVPDIPELNCYNRPVNSIELFKNEIQRRVFVRADADHRITSAVSGTPIETPWIFDFRALMLDAPWLDIYAEIFWEKYAYAYPFQVGGLETASIALISAIVMKSVQRGTPVNGFFIRKSRKREGLMKQVEGTLNEHPVILVDDLINSGGSFQKQIVVLEALQARVSNIFAIVAFRASDAYAFATKKNISVDTLFTLRDFGLPLQTSITPDSPQESFDIVWTYRGPQPSLEHVVQKSAPILDAHRIYFGTDAGTFIALDQASGTEVWRFQIGRFATGKGIFSTPVVHEGTVYFGAYDGNMYALDAATGTVRWKNTDADWIGSSPDIAPKLGLVYIGLEFGLFKKRGGIAAIDIRTGKTMWRDTTPSLTHGSPLYIAPENMVVIGSNDGIVYAYDAQKGTKQWQYQTSGDIKTTPAYDAATRGIIINSMDGRVYALSIRGALLWAFEAGGPLYSIPLIHDKFVYAASLDKHVYALDIETGKKTYEFATLGRIFASPIVADGSLWIGSNDGRLYELAPDTLKQKSFHQFSERIVSKIAHNPATQTIFVKTIANEVYCLKKKNS